MFQKRRLRKMQVALEADRATWDLLGEVTVTFADVGTAAVAERWTDGLTDDELDWLRTYIGVAYLTKLLYNLVGMPDAEWMWDEVRAGTIHEPSAHLHIVGEVPTPLALFQAQVFRKPDAPIPFLQSPTMADGDEGPLARQAVNAVLGALQSHSPEQAARIERGLALVVEHFDTDTYEPDDVQSMGIIPYVVMSELEDEGLLVPDTFETFDFD